MEKMEMYGPNTHDISRFYVAGINYKKTDASVRGEFAVTPEKYEHILSGFISTEITEFFILSTCNRTEIYGLTSDVSHLVDVLCKHTAGDKETFLSRAYIKNGQNAIEHLFHVAA